MSRLLPSRTFGRRALGLTACLVCSSFTLTLLAADAPQEPVEVGSLARVEVYPTHVKLETPRRRMHLIVSAQYPDGRVQDLTRVAEFTSAGEQIVKVQDRVLVPAGNGRTEVNVKVAGKELKVRAVLAGRLTRRGDEFAISAELIDVTNDRQIWGSQYTRKVADLLARAEAARPRELGERTAA